MKISNIYIPPFDRYPIYKNLADGLETKRWTNRLDQPHGLMKIKGGSHLFVNLFVKLNLHIDSNSSLT